MLLHTHLLFLLNINKVFCSELITEVYADYNVQLFDISPSQVTPESFENSNKFKIVTDECINEVSNLPDYISIIYDKENKIKTTALQIQEKSITNINKKIVKKYKENENIHIPIIIRIKEINIFLESGFKAYIKVAIKRPNVL